MRRILLSAAMIVFVVAAVVGGTGAFFSDTETSTGNTFTAGALDLKVDSVAHYNGMICFDSGPDFSDGYVWHPGNIVEWVPGVGDEDGFYQLVPGSNIAQAIEDFNTENPALNPMAGEECGGTWSLTDLGVNNTFFDFDDLKPGDNGENTISLHVENNDAYMCVAIHNVVSSENGCTEPEAEDGDTTCDEPGAGQGELDQELNFFVWEDDGDNIWQQDENILVENATGENISDVYELYSPALENVFTGGETQYIGVYWCYGDFEVDGGVLTCDGASATNLTQTDSLTADISFYVEQARNNEDFTCPDIDDFETDPTTPTPFTLFHNADEDNDGDAVRVASLGSHDGSLHDIDDLFTVEDVYGTDEEFTLEITNGGDDYEFVVTTPFAVSGSDNSMSILIDTDNDVLADFQFEYTNNTFQYKERDGGGFSNAATPTGYTSVESGAQQVFTFTLPKADLDAVFKVAVNATNNNSPQAGTHLQMGIPEWDVFDGGNWTSSANYLLVDTN